MKLPRLPRRRDVRYPFGLLNIMSLLDSLLLNPFHGRRRRGKYFQKGRTK